LIQFGLLGVIDAQHFTQTVVESVGMKSASSRQFGGRIKDASDNHGDDEIAFATGMRVEEGFQLELAQGAEDGGDVTVRKRADDVEGIWGKRADEGVAFEDLAERFDLGGGPVGQVGEGAVVDLTPLAKGLTKEDGGRGVAIGYGGYVHVYYISLYQHIVNTYNNIYMST